MFVKENENHLATVETFIRENPACTFEEVCIYFECQGGDINHMIVELMSQDRVKRSANPTGRYRYATSDHNEKQAFREISYSKEFLQKN